MDWLISQIRLALPTSLGFATDLFQYWASVRHGILTNDGRARARLALVEAAAATFTSVDALLASLGTEHPYALTRLVFPPPTDEPSDPVPFEGWSWLVDLIIEAAKRSPEKILPDVAILVGDTTHGFRTGTFEEGYLLKRDWLSKIFGSRAKEILEILAEYSGPNEYANHAKVAARAWLDEPPLDPTTTTQTS